MSFRNGAVRHTTARGHLRRNNHWVVEVTGKRRNMGIGLEIPATYSFYHKKPSKVKTLRELIRDKEDKAEVN